MKTEAIDKLIDKWEGLPDTATRADLSLALYKLRQDLQQVPDITAIVHEWTEECFVLAELEEK